MGEFRVRKKIFDIKLLKFLLVGIINTLVGMAIMFGLYNLAGCSYWFSSSANYVIGSILSYFLNKYFTFQDKSRSWKTVIRFIVNIVVCYFLAYGIAKPLTIAVLNGQPQRIQENAAMFVGMCFFTGLNYLGQRFFAFKQSET
ncbi:MAG: GtrA domain-containing protein [Oscillospiraceae bacterium]|jgi:putative flippase GtrA